METSMDIVVCLDCTASIASSFFHVRDRISLIIKPMIQNENDIRLALIEFRSCGDFRITTIHPFTDSASTFQSWLDNTQAEGGSQDGTRAISKKKKDFFSYIYFECISGDALREAVKLEWRSDVSKIRFVYR
jgi:hypothetical protein